MPIPIIHVFAEAWKYLKHLEIAFVKDFSNLDGELMQFLLRGTDVLRIVSGVMFKRMESGRVSS